MGDVEIPDTPCSWAGKCMNSEGKCQPCNASPFPNDDRCVCGPGSADWIKPGTCTACTSTPALALPCSSTPSKVCGNPNINCYLDYSCDGHPPPVQCNAGGVGQECRYCGPGTEAGGYVPCPSLNATIRFVARKVGLAGNSDLEFCQADMIACHYEDI